MKTCKYCLTALLVGTTVMVWVGCGNNSTNQPTSTNSVSGTLPSTNSSDTNLPPTTNPPAVH